MIPLILIYSTEFIAEVMISFKVSSVFRQTFAIRIYDLWHVLNEQKL